MFHILLSFYSTSDFIRLFKREIDLTVDEVYVSKFRRWLRRNGFPRRKVMLPYDFHIWLLQRVHEYFRLRR